MDITNQFRRYADTIASLPARFTEDSPRPASLLMASDSRQAIDYAPFDHSQE
jgi:hypothetical protein